MLRPVYGQDQLVDMYRSKNQSSRQNPDVDDRDTPITLPLRCVTRQEIVTEMDDRIDITPRVKFLDIPSFTMQKFNGTES